MVIAHVVFFKIKKDATDEQLENLTTALQGLKNHVPGVTCSNFGANISDKSKGYTHCLYVEVSSRDALESYATNEHHVRVKKEFVTPILDDQCTIDFEV